MKQGQRLLACLAAALALHATGSLAQRNYPDRPIRIVVPYSAGGGNDVLARTVAPKLQERFGQPVVVENKPGAGGNIAVEFVAQSPADGYTLIVANNGFTMTPWIQKNIAFNPVNFAPVSITVALPMGFAVNNELPVKTIAEFIAYAKANPGKLSYGTAGAGTPHHLAMELFQTMTDTKMVMVPYKGAPGMMLDLIPGRINALFSGLDSMLANYQAGKIRLLAVGERARLSRLPEVPTVSETVSGVEVQIWLGFAAPQNTPAAITRRLSDEIRAAVAQPDAAAALKRLGYEINPTTPEEMLAVVQSDYAKWGRVVAAAGIKAD